MTAPAVETCIWMALRGRVAELPVPVALNWPGEALTAGLAATKPEPYLEVRHLPNTLNRTLIGSSGPMERRGILQLSLIYPVALKHDHAVALQMAGLIAAHFPADLRLNFEGVTVRIEQAPDIARPMRDDAFMRWPISVRYRCYA